MVAPNPADAPPTSESMRLLHARRAGTALKAGLGIAIVNFFIWRAALGLHGSASRTVLLLFSVAALAQLACGVFAVVEAVRAQRHAGPRGGGQITLGLLMSLGAVFGWAAGGVVALLASGGAWGRPLRVRGRQLHPALRYGSDWTCGDRPSVAGLDDTTRRALEALWLHDAQKEHASVPAFARIAWMLSAVGAPPDLLKWTQRAALEEIDHAERCFALAAGYGGRTHTVEPMPDLLVEGTGAVADPLTVLVLESVEDGCLLEDFNADLAARCAEVCVEPITRDVLDRIAREERSHAELSWAIVTWVLARDRVLGQAAIERALSKLDRYPRPTAVSADKRALVALASVSAMRSHGRLQDPEWATVWQARLAATRERATRLLEAADHRAA